MEPKQDPYLEGINLLYYKYRGRYDELIGTFSTTQIPSVGASIGIERIFAIVEKKMTDS